MEGAALSALLGADGGDGAPPSIRNGSRIVVGSVALLCRWARALAVPLLAGLFAATTWAADPTGVITGTVTNKTTGTGLLGAKVEIPALKLSAIVDDTGRYLINVPPGTHEMTVSFSGVDPQTATVTVAAGQATLRNFDLTSTILMLDAFKVASEKIGQSSALTQQRNADNLKSVASMDALVDLPNMNATELAIRLPGVTFGDPGDEVVEIISVRGMGVGMTSITIDGGGMSSFQAAARTTRMTAFTGAMFESLELTKGQTPDRSVNSLGGGVNFKTRSPLNTREKRRLTYNLTWRTAPWFTEQVPLREERRNHELFNVSYMEKFRIFGGDVENLAVSVNGFYSENAFGFFRTTRDFQQTNSAPAYVWNYLTQDDYNNRKQQSLSTKFDFRPARNSLLKLNLIYNDAGEPMRKRPLVQAIAGSQTTVPNNFTHTTFVTGQVPSGVVPGFTDRITVVRAVPTAATAATPTSSTTPPAYIEFSSEAIHRDQRLRHVDFAGEHTFGPFEADWAALWSRTRYKNLGSEGRLYMRIGQIPFVGPNGGPGSLTNNIRGPNGETGVGWILDRTRSDLYPSFVQNGGLDFTNPANYRPRLNDGLSTGSGNLQIDFIREARANVRFKLPFESFTAFLKAGASVQDHDVENYIYTRRWNYIGTGPLPVDPKVLTWDQVKTGRKIPQWEATMFIREGQPIEPALWQEDKYYFENNRRTNNYRVNETITGYYAMTQGRIGRFGFLGGIRREVTETAGYSRRRARVLSTTAQQTADPVGSAERDSLPYVNDGKYGENFPSIHTWYDLTPNLKARGSWTTGFARPALTNAVTALSFNDNLQTVTFGNPALLPTKAKNWDFSLEFYFEPSGTLSIGWFHKTIIDYVLANQPIGIVPSGADNGFNGEFANYTILANANAGNAITQGWEVSYSHYFRFLPGILRTLRFNGNFTQIAAHGDYGTAGVYLKNKDVNGFIPRSVNGSLSWDYKKFSTTWSYNYTAENIRGAYNIAQPSRNNYMLAREIVNASFRYHIRPNLTLSIGVANLFNAPQRYYRSVPDQMSVFLMQGTTMTAGLEGRF